ncbi:hypothetical protein Dsin_022374 [Dipteronia sinensis]|uniref:Uncharacterized protein n=1 Tax=Dipteronia sinensis TaxID=43782 RepID=A0AAE0A2D4_9ROSI|nr:hypothetical protein Dsin_022374 [Dipteronia sinensis]
MTYLPYNSSENYNSVQHKLKARSLLYSRLPANPSQANCLPLPPQLIAVLVAVAPVHRRTRHLLEWERMLMLLLLPLEELKNTEVEHNKQRRISQVPGRFPFFFSNLIKHCMVLEKK